MKRKTTLCVEIRTGLKKKKRERERERKKERERKEENKCISQIGYLKNNF